jgi:hypothetical protein
LRHCKVQVLFRQPCILVGIHQIPVDVLDLIDGRNDLEAKRDIGNLAIVLGNANEAIIRSKAEALHQVLRQLNTET